MTSTTSAANSRQRPTPIAEPDGYEPHWDSRTQATRHAGRESHCDRREHVSYVSAQVNGINRALAVGKQQYHRGVHTETGATPAQRYHAQGRTPAPRPDPALLRRAFLWREQRRVTAFATVSLHGIL